MEKANFTKDNADKMDKTDPDYGKPQKGTRTELRGQKAHTHVHKVCSLFTKNWRNAFLYSRNEAARKEASKIRIEQLCSFSIPSPFVRGKFSKNYPNTYIPLER